MTRIAVYAGTFDPVTSGHQSVIERALRLFDRLIVVVALNPAKNTLFNLEQRLQLVRLVTSRHAAVDCQSTTGLVVELARKRGASALVRGVRGNSDAAFETRLAQINHDLAPEIETVFLPADSAFAEVSSSRLKELAEHGGDGLRFCHPEVWRQLCQRLTKRRIRERDTDVRL